MSIEKFKESLLKSEVIEKKNGYSYVVNPILDGFPDVDPFILKEIANELKNRIKKCGDFDKIVTVECMGIPIATLLSNLICKPFLIVRKKSFDLDTEVCVKQKTGYSESNLYINGIKENDRVVIVDDVLSTGGTLKTVVSGLKRLNVEVVGAFVIVNKSNNISQVSKDISIPIYSLVDIDIFEDKVIIKN